MYTLGPNVPFAVPTVPVFARFAEGVCAQVRKGDIERAGFALVEILAYAPNAARLPARRGAIAGALTGASRLEPLAKMDNVEPQMLMQSARR